MTLNAYQEELLRKLEDALRTERYGKVIEYGLELENSRLSPKALVSLYVVLGTAYHECPEVNWVYGTKGNKIGYVSTSLFDNAARIAEGMGRNDLVGNIRSVRNLMCWPERAVMGVKNQLG